MSWLLSAWAWLGGSKAGRIAAAITAALAAAGWAVLTIRRDERERLAAQSARRQAEQLRGGQDAEARYRSGGGAADRLRDGTF